MIRYLITRQNKDGTFDSVGMNNRALISGYKTYRNAFKFAINPFGRGALVRVEVYRGSVYGEPSEVFSTVTFSETK